MNADENTVGSAVAIIGRPNVGKSALFNRLAGRRMSIVHHESGVTRDRLVAEANWHGRSFEIMDTGGIFFRDGEEMKGEITGGIQRQVDEAIKDAAVLVIVADIQIGLHPMDEETARLARLSGKRTIVAANKADTTEHDGAAADFGRLGFPVYAVSATHGRGIDTLARAILEDLPARESTASGDALKIAVVGRPNVGKSSYVNCLLGRERVIVSSVPGTTRDSVDVPFSVGDGDSARRYVLIDTAGMRKKGRIDSAVEQFGRFRAEASIRRADVVVVVLDAVEGPKEQDKKIATLIDEHAKGAIVLVNKWDLAKGSGVTREEYGKSLGKEVPALSHCPICFVSCVTNYHVMESLRMIDAVAAQMRMKLPTALLNRVVSDAQAARQPTMVEGRRLKIFYAVQTGTAPIRLRMFVNDPRLVTQNYRRYVLNRLRDGFGLEGAAVAVEWAARARGPGIGIEKSRRKRA